MKIQGILYIVGISILLASCARNPVTGKRELSLMSESQEIAMGKEYDPSIVAEYGVYENPKMQAFIT
ncbi:MAG TPA: hypothetical protein PJ990_10345, partial [Saprospiraceae bacterium]|nr:hypothetical protein [Saprospiraceae bacterium]